MDKEQRKINTDQSTDDVVETIRTSGSPRPSDFLFDIARAKSESDLTGQPFSFNEMTELIDTLSKEQARAFIDRTIDYDFSQSDDKYRETRIIARLLAPDHFRYLWSKHANKAPEYTRWWLVGQSGFSGVGPAFEALSDVLCDDPMLPDDVDCMILKKYLDESEHRLSDLARYFNSHLSADQLARYSRMLYQKMGIQLATSGAKARASLSNSEVNKTEIDQVAVETKQEPLDPNMSGWLLVEKLLKHGYDINSRIKNIESFNLKDVEKIINPIMKQDLTKSLEYLLNNKAPTRSSTLQHYHIKDGLSKAAKHQSLGCMKLVYNQYGPLDDGAGDVLTKAYDNDCYEVLEFLFTKEDPRTLILLGASKFGQANTVHDLLDIADVAPRTVAPTLYQSALRVDRPKPYLDYLADTLELDPNEHIHKLYSDVIELGNGSCLMQIGAYKQWINQNVNQAVKAGLRL